MSEFNREFKKEDWVNTVSREIPIPVNCLIVKSYEETYPEIDFEFLADYFANDTYLCGNGLSIKSYRYKPSYEKLNEIISNKFDKNKGVFEEAYKKSVDKKDEIDQTLSEIKRIADEDNHKLNDFKKWFDKTRSLFLSFFALQVSPFIIEQVLEEAGNKKLLDRMEAFLVKWRKDTHEYNAKIESSLHDFLDAFKAELKKDVEFWTDEEIQNFLDGGSEPDEKAITERKKKYVMFWDISESPPYQILTGDKAETIREKLGRVTERDSNTEQFKGTPVSSGTAQGEAFVVGKKEDLEDIPEDRIVVSEVVELEDLKRIKTSNTKAIITEEGGITSHIAISGREMAVPIVMGVDNIVESLNSGDKVEVDANEGVVKLTDER